MTPVLQIISLFLLCYYASGHDGYHHGGVCGFPCSLQNKTYELCPCDPNNKHQTYMVDGNNDVMVLRETVGNSHNNWECFWRSGRFYIVRRFNDRENYQYRCMKDSMYDTDKDIRVFCMSDWVTYPNTTVPHPCEVCGRNKFDKKNTLTVKEKSVDCGCELPLLCSSWSQNTTACNKCETSEGNDDGFCCPS